MILAQLDPEVGLLLFVPANEIFFSVFSNSIAYDLLITQLSLRRAKPSSRSKPDSPK